MQTDKLLQDWKKAKAVCLKIIQKSKAYYLQKSEYGNLEESKSPILINKNQFMEVYDIVYKLCITRQKEENRVSMVYKQYKELLKEALIAMCQFLKNSKDFHRLRVVRKIWDAYTDVQKKLRHMFAYLNRPYHIKQGKIEDLEVTAINVMLNTLFNQNTVGQYENLYFKEVEKIRLNKDFVQQQILSKIVEIYYLIHLKVIKSMNNKKARTIYTELQLKYQKQARKYYNKKYKTISELSPSEYYIEVKSLYELETKLAETCYVISGQTLINREFSDEFILSYRQTLLSSPYGLKFIFKNKDIEIIKMIIELNMKLLKNLEGFKEQFQDFIFEQMKSHIEETKNELLIKRNVNNYCKFMHSIIKKNTQFITILEESLVLFGDFVPYYKNGVEKAFNMSALTINIEEVLAIYVDAKFKSSLSIMEFEEEVKSIISIFNCVQNKDLFLLKYSQKLAKRILYLNEQALKNHEVFINNLKLNCGVKYTQKLESIITEYNISLQNDNQLQQINRKQNLQIHFNVKIFSQGQWPSSNILDVNISLNFLPPQIENAMKCLSIYQKQFMERKDLLVSALESKIRWIYYFEEEEIKAKSQIINQQKTQNEPSKIKEKSCYIDTNCLQSALLFYLYRNRPNQTSYQIISQLFSKVNTKTIQDNLNKLCQGDNILSRKKDQDTTLYSFNCNLVTHKKLISYEMGSVIEEDRLFQKQNLDKDRQIIIDANLSKYMKSKKISDFKTLISEIPKMIKVFLAQTKDIKLAIDRLIHKEILERDQKDRDIVKYKH